MRIPDSTIEEVRRANDIVDVVSAYVHLKKRGKNYVGLCPFHKEKTPSFTVSGEKQMYHCFGCSKGGNVYTFVMEVERVSFVEAVRSLAARVGIAIVEESQISSETQNETENLHAICRFAGIHFHENLTKTDEGKSALDYFHKRGFTDETIQIFGLGYSLNLWDGLLQRAKSEGFSSEIIVKAGLARQRDDGSLYDYFRGRVMFPIFSIAGRVIAFGARKIREDDAITGKYINSPETPLYNKSRVLFGLFHSKEAIRQQDMALMVEGYADLISLFQAGIKNVVASSGTALTEEQLTLIGRYSKNLTLVYDGDTAGSSATVRGIDLAHEQDLNVRIVELPQGDDPDSFVQKNGGRVFQEKIPEAISFIDFKATQFVSAGAFTTPEGKTQAIRSLVRSIAKMKDEMKRNFYIKEIAEKYDVYESLLFRELENALTQERRLTQNEPDRFLRYAASTEKLPEIQEIRTKEIPAEERDLLKVFLEGNSEIIQFVLSHISMEQISTVAIRRLMQLAVDESDEQGSVDANSILNKVHDSELKNIISNITLSRYELSNGWKDLEKEIDEPNPLKIARDAIVAIHRKRIQEEIEKNRQALKSVTQKRDDPMPLMHRQQELVKALQEMESPEYLKVV